MSNGPEPIVDELFAAAVALAPALRCEFLESRCGGDTSLRAELEALLECHDAAGDFLEVPPITSVPDPAVPLVREPETVPERIGAFHIERVLGVGGMGRVYLARTEHPRRQVALKVLRSGMASPPLLRRFAQEAQVVALLQHPGIAQLYEAGTAQTPDGACPFFAMEYVDGPALTGFARQRSLSTPQRLELLCRVCDAVQHAHQRGVVHRDLKPGNILVDATGQPKILDFGVARLSDPDPTVTTLHTHAGQLIGTLSYMSPEQVGGDPSQVDARSDVYSLGVILFELLTGKLPHDVASRTIPDAIRVIREDPPTSLSTIDRTYRGDIETIVGKALDKDQGRRYQSAAELAADIRRSLRDEPIVARPPSTWYQLGKFTKRNKTIVGGAVATFAALLAGLVVSIWQASAAFRAREAADQARRHAEETADITNETNKFLQQLFSSPDPDERLGRDVTVMQVLDRSVKHLEEALPTYPHVQAALHRTIGNTYRNLTEFAKAETHLRAAYEIDLKFYGAEHEETLASMSQLIHILSDKGKMVEALQLGKRQWEIARGFFTQSDPRYAACAADYAFLLMETGDWRAAEELQRTSLALREKLFQPDDEEILTARSNLAKLLARSGRPREALEMQRDIVAKYRASGRPLNSASFNYLLSLANILMDLNYLDEAQPLCDDLLTQGKALFDDIHPAMLAARNLQAELLLREGRFAEAETILRALVEENRRNQVPAADGLVRFINNLGEVLDRQHRYDESEAVYREALQVLDQDGVRPSSLRLAILNNLATSLHFQKKIGETLPILAEAVKTGEQVMAPNDWRLSAAKYGYAVALASHKQMDEAEVQLKQAYDIALQTLDPSDERVITVMRTFVDLYTFWEKPEQAEYWRQKLPEKYRHEE